MSPGKIIDQDGRVIMYVDKRRIFVEKDFEGGQMSLEELPPGIRGTYRITQKDEFGVLTTETKRRVPPLREAPFDIETNKGRRNLIIKSE